MGRTTFTRFGVAVALVLAVGGAGMGPASAARSAPHPAARRLITPIGHYSLFAGVVDSATLTVTADNTFDVMDATTGTSASGTWVAQGSGVALMLTTNEVDGLPDNCVLIGTIGQHGLNSLAKQGVSSCGYQWYATRATPPAARRPDLRARHGAASQVVNPLGTYRIFSSNGGVGKLKVKAAHAIGSSYGDVGQWISLNKVFAFGVSTSAEEDEGCIYIATISATGFASKAAPGLQYCPVFGGLQWYAKKPKP